MVAFSYYGGGIKGSKCVSHITLERFVEIHRNPPKKMQTIFDEIELASKNGDKKRKAELKAKLYSFTPSVLIRKGFKRRYTSVRTEDWTNLMQMDFDKIPDQETAEALKLHLFENYPQIVCAYLSPSRLGVKCLLKITKPDGLLQFKALHKAVTTEMEQFGYFDEATRNGVLPLFLSHDKEILFRSWEETKTWDIEDWSVPERADYSYEKPAGARVGAGHHEKRTIRIITDRLIGINNNGHPQLRDAGLILGSRVCAGYISEGDARHLIERLVNFTPYFSKDVRNYQKTAVWAVSEGMKRPVYYD